MLGKFSNTTNKLLFNAHLKQKCSPYIKIKWIPFEKVNKKIQTNVCDFVPKQSKLVANWLIMVFLLAELCAKCVICIYFNQLYSQVSPQNIIFRWNDQENTRSCYAWEKHNPKWMHQQHMWVKKPKLLKILFFRWILHIIHFRTWLNGGAII